MKKLMVLLFLALWTTGSRAQFSVGTDLNLMFDDNIDNNYLQITDRITSVSLGLEYLWSDEKYETGISYTGSMNYYSSVIERSFSSHELLFNYAQVFGEEDEAILEFDAGLSGRIDRGNYTIYDHHVYHGAADLQYNFSDVTAGQIKYLFQVIRFKNLEDFNYTEHNVGAEFSSSFESRTSVTLGSSFGIKIYSDQTSSITDTTAGGSGSGQGSGGGGAGTHVNTITQTSTPTVTQLVCMGRIAQSIFEGTGISLTGQYQWNMKKESRYLYGSIPDDVIFEDHYGYEGLLVSMMLTQVLPFNSRIRLIAGRQNRLYSTLPAYDLIGNLVSDKRNDTRTVYTVQFKKDIEELNISVNAAYDYIINSSNDMFYDYTNRAFTLGISLLF